MLKHHTLLALCLSLATWATPCTAHDTLTAMLQATSFEGLYAALQHEIPPNSQWALSIGVGLLLLLVGQRRFIQQFFTGFLTKCSDHASIR